MGLFKNVRRPAKTDPVERDLTLSLPHPVPPRKVIYNLPKTSPPQDFLITNVVTQGQIPWVWERLSIPHTKRNPTRVHTMGQDHPITRPSPGVNPTIYPSPLVLTSRGQPEDRIQKVQSFRHDHIIKNTASRQFPS